MQLAKTAMPFLAALCMLSMAAARADDNAPPPHEGSHMAERCKQDPDKCRKMKERREAWCKDHAERCEEMKKKRQEMRELCKKDPQACQQKRAEMREKFKQRMEERCKQNPEKCEEWKKHHNPGNNPDEAAPDH